jgi:hypothetical protein
MGVKITENQFLLAMLMHPRLSRQFLVLKTGLKLFKNYSLQNSRHT